MTDRGSGSDGFFKRIPTGLKMLIVLSISLLPLGLIAILASIDTANTARENREASARLLAEFSAGRITNAVARTAISLRAAATAVAFDERETRRCEDTLSALAALDRYAVNYAIMNTDGSIICATGEFAPRRIDLPGDTNSVTTRLNSADGVVTFAVSGANRQTIGVAQLSSEALINLTEPTDATDAYRLVIRQGEQSLLVHDWPDGERPDDIRSVEAQAANGQLGISTSYGVTPLRAAELLSIALPLLMWAGAALLGWFAVNRMVLRPMARLQRAVAEYAESGGEFALPSTRTPAIEIRELGNAFQSVVTKLRANERQLEDGLSEQRRLTREVHHRVKNNLQVVASLLNLHARAAKTAETAAAYASIQRRVEALAIVQRNLFAEEDASRGVLIRPVIAELASGLQQSAPENVAISVTLDIANVSVEQDVAAPIAFFITELVELAMQCSDQVEIEIAISTPHADDPATLSVYSRALEDAEEHLAYSRYNRVLTGLARQLRSNVEKNYQGARFSVDIPTI